MDGCRGGHGGLRRSDAGWRRRGLVARPYAVRPTGGRRRRRLLRGRSHQRLGGEPPRGCPGDGRHRRRRRPPDTTGPATPRHHAGVRARSTRPRLHPSPSPSPATVRVRHRNCRRRAGGPRMLVRRFLRLGLRRRTAGSCRRRHGTVDRLLGDGRGPDRTRPRDRGRPGRRRSRRQPQLDRRGHAALRPGRGLARRSSTSSWRRRGPSTGCVRRWRPPVTCPVARATASS